MEIYFSTLASSAFIMTATLLALAKLIPDEYDRRRPARVVAARRPPEGR